MAIIESVTIIYQSGKSKVIEFANGIPKKPAVALQAVQMAAKAAAAGSNNMTMNIFGVEIPVALVFKGVGWSAGGVQAYMIKGGMAGVAGYIVKQFSGQFDDPNPTSQSIGPMLDSFTQLEFPRVLALLRRTGELVGKAAEATNWLSALMPGRQ